MAEQRMEICTESDIIQARQIARVTAQSLGLGAVDQSRIATAVSELARNVVRYATDGTGSITIRSIETPEGKKGIEVVVQDNGPGLDVQAALEPGYTTGRGMGLGLPGTKRLMDEMILDSEVGRGTTITIRKWKR